MTIIGTRGSDLALWQARFVAQSLGGEAAGVRLEIIRTEGDRKPDVELVSGTGVGAFTKELEAALLDGRIDVAVHSLKDLPTTIADGLAIAAVPERADVGDVLLVRPDALSDDELLPVRRGARVGTGSPRRQALLAWLRPDLVAGPFRGNVPTRVDKCRRGEVDAVVLARAGLVRLGLDAAPLAAFDLDPATWLPAPAQGALGVECRANDVATRAKLAPLDHAPSATCAAIERELLARLGAGCHAALGAWCRRKGGELTLDAGMLGDDGAWRRVRAVGPGDDVACKAIDELASTSQAAVSARAWTPAAPWRAA